MNKQQQAEEIVEKYIKPLYSYALKKTANLQDAEDLAQDIIFRLYKALLNKEIYNLDAFVWRLAHNVLVNYYRGKARSSIGVSLDELTPSLCSDEELSDGMIKKESIKKLQHEIAYLSKTQREILIMYYYEGRRLEEISGRLKLPLGTVKWHLFCARNEIKKGMDEMRNANELKFNPIKFAGAGISGSLGTMGGPLNFFRSTLTQNIAYSVYREAKSINEIADCIGVSPVFVEGEVEFLEEYGYLIKKGDKYLANLIINELDENSEDLARLKDELYARAAKLIANELYDELIKSDLLNSDRLYYPDGDKNFLAWGLVPYLLANSTEGFEEKISFDEVATLRKDGAHNITYVYIKDENEPKSRYHDSMQKWNGPMWNGIHNGEERLVLWQVISEWSDRDKEYESYTYEAVQQDLKLLCRFIRNELLSSDEIAYMVQKGYLKAVKGSDDNISLSADVGISKAANANATNDKFELAVIWLKDETIKEELVELCNRVRAKCQKELMPLKEEYEKLALENVPKHLKKMVAYGLQYTFYSDGPFLLYSLKELISSGRLKLPKEEQRVSLSILILQ